MADLKAFNPYKVEGLKRIGNKNDGGYVIHYPSLQQVECLVNYGVGYNVEFEKSFNKLTNSETYAFDPTMKKPEFFIEKIKQGKYFETFKQVIKLLIWLTQENSLKKYKINFIEEGLSDKNSDFFKTLNYHFEKYNLKNKKTLLKIDIEGGEYDILTKDNFYDTLDNVVQLLLEFHYLKDNIEKISKIIENLKPTHSLIHIHGNNNGGTFSLNGKNIPEVIEVTFLHNSYLPNKTLSTLNYPAKGLDYPCNRHREDLVLDFFR